MGREQFTRDDELYYGRRPIISVAGSASRMGGLCTYFISAAYYIDDARLEGLRVAKDSECNCVD